MRREVLAIAALCALAGCAEPAHYTYPPAYQAPMAPPAVHPRPAPVYVAPQPRAVKPLHAGLLTARNVEGYMDDEERELRTVLRGSGVGVSRPGDQIGLYLRSDILFESDTAHLSPRADQVLIAIGAILAKYDSTVLTVNGYADTKGPAAQALDLSRARADAVAKALASDGVDAHRIVTNGYGQTHLKIPTPANVSEPRNRRVEIIVMPKMAG